MVFNGFKFLFQKNDILSLNSRLNKMWTGKSAAKTFFSRLFEKKKKKDDSHDIRPARWVKSMFFAYFFLAKFSMFQPLLLNSFSKNFTKKLAKYERKCCEILHSFAKVILSLETLVQSHFRFKGTVSVILSDLTFQDGNA